MHRCGVRAEAIHGGGGGSGGDIRALNSHGRALSSAGSAKNLRGAANKSFVGKDMLENGGHYTASGGQPSDLFNLFHLQHIEHTDSVLFPVDLRPLPPLTSKKANKALGIMSAVALSRGKRPYMEDMVCNVPVVADELQGFEDHPQGCFFGVFDGHGGYDRLQCWLVYSFTASRESNLQHKRHTHTHTHEAASS